MKLSDIAQIVGGKLFGSDATVNDFCTDTRHLQAGQLFIALRGPHFDGDAFATQAQQSGAVAAVVHQYQQIDLPQIVVTDTRIALADLARHLRHHSSAKVIALTGSNGKTTTKELLRRLLATQGRVLATEGNLNNDIGVPLTLLRLQGDEDFAVIEMGANHAGEITQLVGIAEPDTVLVTNVAAAHLEGFGSLEGVIHAKGELYAASGTADVVLNVDLSCAAQWQRQYSTRVCRTFGIQNKAEVTAVDISMDGSAFTLRFAGQQARINWQLQGQHNVLNALAAFAVASLYGVTPKMAALAWHDLRLTQGRLTAYQVGTHKVYDDTYNANPASFKAGIDVVSAMQPALVVAGAMGELGIDAPKLHRDVAQYARTRGISAFWCVGEAARVYGEEDDFIRYFPNAAAAATALRHWLDEQENSAVLVKGSRSAHMEKVITLAGIGGDTE